MRIYFDASVIIAALLSPSGGSALLLQYIKTGKIHGIISQTVVEEVLSKTKKLKKTEAELEQFITTSNFIVRRHILIEETEQYQGMIAVEDAHLIAGAHLTKCSHLVTLDKQHLLRVTIQKKFLPLKILSPKELLEEIVLL